MIEQGHISNISSLSLIKQIRSLNIVNRVSFISDRLIYLNIIKRDVDDIS